MRYPSLDGIRAIAILLVVGYHLEHYVDPAFAGLKAFLATGWNGVHLFFVLSGFLIGSLAFKEIARTGEIAVGRFWARRFFRTWPLYFVILFFSYLRAESIHPGLIHYLTFTQNFFENPFFVQTWSLAVEEQFYFVFPVVLLILLKLKRTEWVTILLAAGIFGAAWFRARNGHSTHTFAVMDSLMVGILIALIHEKWPERLEFIKRSPNFHFVAGVLCAYLPYFIPAGTGAREVVLLTGLASGFGLILVSALSESLFLNGVLRARIAYFVALVSYSIYLSHDRPAFRIGQVVNAYGLTGWSNVVFVLVGGMVFCVLVGAILYFLIEKPGLWLRDRIFPRA